MKTLLKAYMAVGVIAAGASVWADGQAAEEDWNGLLEQKSRRKAAFAYVENNPDLPNVLIYGDSISISYTPVVRKELEGKANVYRIHRNGGDTARVFDAMPLMLDTMKPHWDFDWDVIHFNCGLHDLKYLNGDKLDTVNGTQVRSVEEYGKKLEEVILYFKGIAPGARLVFATTTPVPENSRGRKAGDAARYNQAALKVLEKFPEIEVNDLYALTKPHQEEWWVRPGNVHFNQAGYTAQGKQVACMVAGKIEPTLESLQKHFKTPEWLQDAKLGVYTHWGPVTQAIRHHEQGNFGWYARFMHQEGHAAQAYHFEHYGDPKQVPYTEIMKEFTAPKFNAEEWAEMIAGAGAKFAGPVSIHHDNFAMWDSGIHRWNSKAIGPKRDIAGELATAYRAKGMKFLGAFHHGFTYHFYEFARRPGYQGSDPAYADLYGPVDERDKQTRFIPRGFQEQWLALVNEYCEKYNPDVIYYDFGLGWQDKDIQYRMYADYYNRARKNGQEVTVLQKERDALHRTFATMDLERGRMDELTDYTWTTDTSAGPWFYHKNPAWEDSNAMIDMFIDIVSKNGVMLLNVAPDYEGAFPPEMKKMLADFGTFTKMNGEGIYGTRPWPVYGEGRTQADAGHFKIENSKARKEAKYNAGDIRYTRSKDWKTVYAFVLDWPFDLAQGRPAGEVTLNGIEAHAEGTVSLLGGEELPYVINKDKTITVTFPEKKVGDFAHGLKFEGFEPKPHPNGFFEQPNAIHIPADKATVHGWSIKNDGEKIHNWSAWWGGSHWLFSTKVKNGTFGLRAKMTNTNPNSELEIKVFNDRGDMEIFTVLPPKTGSEPEYIRLGEVDLKNDGVYQIKMGAKPDRLKRNAIEIYELQVAPLKKKAE